MSKVEEYESTLWPKWLARLEHSPGHVLLLPGIMGSELYDQGEESGTLWIRPGFGLSERIARLAYARLEPDGSVDMPGSAILGRRDLQIPFWYNPYERILDSSLQPALFAFDWRESLPLTARYLARFLRKAIERGIRPLRIVTHSMGGNLLLQLLALTPEFDQHIDRIIFCAPPFRGALAGVRAIETGGISPISLIVDDDRLAMVASTFPGLFQLLVAPQDIWPRGLPMPDGSTVSLAYPVSDTDGALDLYRPASWSSRFHLEMRETLLHEAMRVSRKAALSLARIAGNPQLREKTAIIVGVNGPTPYRAERRASGHWRFGSAPRAGAGRLRSGDGTVLFQSSFVPEIGLERHFGFNPGDGVESHGYLMHEPDVIAAVDELLQGRIPTGLLPGAECLRRIEFDPDQYGPLHFDYLERERLRSLVPYEGWSSAGLTAEADGTNDFELFHRTRHAARRVFSGGALAKEAERAGVTEEHLRRHALRMFLPLC